MHGSYALNEGVKGGRGPAPVSPNPVQQSYKKCLCLIATVIVFTVVAVIVLLALNSKAKEVYEEPVRRVNAYKVYGIKQDETTTTTTSTTAPKTTTKAIHNEWDIKQDHENHFEIRKVFRENPSTTTTTILPVIRRMFIAERFPVTPSSVVITTAAPQQQQHHHIHELPTDDPEWQFSSSYEQAQQSTNEADDLAASGFQNHNDDDKIHYPVQFIEQRTGRLSHIFSTTTAKPVPTTLKVPVTIDRKTTEEPFLLPDIPAKYTMKKEECQEYCGTKSCQRSLASMLIRMDFNEDPCEDFYKHACNGLVLNEYKPPSTNIKFRKQIRTFLNKDSRPDPFLHKYKTFYQSCLDYKCDGTTDPVVRYFRPLMNSVPPEGDEKTHNLTYLIVRILLDGHPTSRVMPIFDVEVTVDEKLGKIPVITMPISNSLMLSAHTGDLYEETCRSESKKFSEVEKSTARIVDAYENCLTNYTSYIRVLEKSMNIFEIFQKWPEFDREQRLKQIITTIEWEVLDVVKRLSDREIMREQKSSEKVTIQELYYICPAIEWNVLFGILYEGSVNVVRVQFMDRLKDICKFYESQDYDTLHDVILSMLAHDWYVEFMRPTQIPDRAEYCDKLSQSLMPDVVSNVFMTHVSFEPLRSFEKLIGKLFSTTKTNLLSSIQNVKWMTKEQRKIVSDEIDKVSIVENYPLILKQDGIMEMNMVLYMSQTDFVSNVLVLKRRVRTLFRELNSIPNATLYSLLYDPLADHVQYLPGRHEIFIPLPILNAFVEDDSVADLKMYESMARLGFPIGRALLQPLEIAKLKKLFSEHHEENTELDSFEDSLILDSPIKSFRGLGLELDFGITNASMDSRFADDGSLRLGLDSYMTLPGPEERPFYQSDKSLSKTFFLLVAQQFCKAPESSFETGIDLYLKKDLTNHLRVNSMIMNSVAFKDLYNCPLGSVMHPVMKNHQFPHLDDLNIHF